MHAQTDRGAERQDADLESCIQGKCTAGMIRNIRIYFEGAGFEQATSPVSATE